MAMDKDRLLAYFHNHYLSRQEVLFKLPLNVSIDAFWPELLNRRKASANILPLLNASGMPYWYVLTDKMVGASERLCAEAMEQEDSFDPYRTPMTSAMTEEMFFTSFVEGAQIPLQEAMDFLQRGTEPENIQEQMIWNNRHAWSGMVGSLYRPLDEGFTKTLAFMLTEEMDNCAEDYRQTDQHPIAAMNTEPYEVPSAYSLPERMADYYAFMQAGDVHPLIKAAVGQAYILVARPFPEGNERLSRMISSAVLLRSGYDFFRDISISSVIAKESYRYYKCMREILRPENGGDLTYFLEYYLDLLVRTIDAKKEREQRRAQEALESERELAKEPLRAPSIPSSQADTVLPDEANEPLPNDDQRATKPWPFQPLHSFIEQVWKLRHSPKSAHREYPVKVQKMLDQGLIRFSVSQWSQVQGITRKNADYECRFLYQKGLTDRHQDVNPMEYSFRISCASDNPPKPAEENEVEPQHTEANESPPVVTYSFENKLRQFEQSRSDMKRRAAAAIRTMLSKGITTFSRQELAEYAQLNEAHSKDASDAMIACGMIVNTAKHSHPAVYHFNLSKTPAQEHASQPLVVQLKEMVKNKSNQRDYRIGTFLLEILNQGLDTFSSLDWKTRFKVTKSQYASDIRRALNLGFVRKDKIIVTENGTQYAYRICTKVHEGIRSNDLTDVQKEYLSKLYEEFAGNKFSVDDMVRLLQTCGASAHFHLSNFTERGILNQLKRPGKASQYIFAVTSEDHPECFVQISGPIEPTEKEKRKSETAMSLASTTDLTASA